MSGKMGDIEYDSDPSSQANPLAHLKVFEARNETEKILGRCTSPIR
jgi:hypothetical protein